MLKQGYSVTLPHLEACLKYPAGSTPNQSKERFSQVSFFCLGHPLFLLLIRETRTFEQPPILKSAGINLKLPVTLTLQGEAGRIVFHKHISLFFFHTNSLCEDCITSDACGFCFEEGSSKDTGSCLPAYTDRPEQYAQLTYTHLGNATEAVFRCSKQNVWDLERDSRVYHWADSFCPTSYSWMAVLGLALFVMGFAPG